VADKIRALQNDLREAMKGFDGLADKLPKDVDAMVQCLQEMKNGAEPDDTADYWEERKKIDQNMSDVSKLKLDFGKLQQAFQKKKGDIEAAAANARKAADIDALAQVARDLQAIRDDVDEKLNQAYDIRDEVQDIKKDMGECELPVNIGMRRAELEGFSERLDRINDDFRDLRQADDDFVGDSASEQEIKRSISKIERSLRDFEQEGKDLYKYQVNPLEKYGQKDFVNFTITVKIIIQVREFKAKIYDTNERLKDLEALLQQLNAALIQQDMENATKLLRKKANKLRERLTSAKRDLRKISDCGGEMEGNTTHNEEDEFIDALKDEMP
jgi:uncharacterized coiled-coil DUF342 family protein